MGHAEIDLMRAEVLGKYASPPAYVGMMMVEVLGHSPVAPAAVDLVTAEVLGVAKSYGRIDKIVVEVLGQDSSA